MLQRLASLPQLAFSPAKKAKIAVGILQQRIDANGFLILRSCLCILPRLDEQYSAKIADTRILRILTFRGRELRKRVPQPIFFQCRQPSLERIILLGLSKLNQTPAGCARCAGPRIEPENNSCYGSWADLVITPRRSVCFSSFSCDSRFSVVDIANSCAAFSFSPNAWYTLASL